MRRNDSFSLPSLPLLPGYGAGEKFSGFTVRLTDSTPISRLPMKPEIGDRRIRPSRAAGDPLLSLNPEQFARRSLCFKAQCETVDRAVGGGVETRHGRRWIESRSFETGLLKNLPGDSFARRRSRPAITAGIDQGQCLLLLLLDRCTRGRKNAVAESTP